MLRCAFEKLGMVAVNADVLLKNACGQYVMETVGDFIILF